MVLRAFALLLCAAAAFAGEKTLSQGACLCRCPACPASTIRSTPEGLDRILSLIGDRFLDRLLEAANSMTQPDLARMWNMSVVTPAVPDLKVLTFAG